MIYKSIFDRIREHCTRGSSRDIDEVISMLDGDVELPVTKAVDFFLGKVNTGEGIRRIKYKLFNGTRMQRNYCTLFFARRDEWGPVNKVYELGLVDWKQAYSR